MDFYNKPSIEEYLYHHGILGQHWGVKNGPPYPLGGGDYSPSERKAITNKRKRGNSIYNKKHYDEVLKADKTTLQTLSFNKNRTQNTDMFYATHDKLDKHQYNAMFNKPTPQPVYDSYGNKIGTGIFMKYRINNSLKTDIKVASEDSAANVFRDLYKKDRDFYNFVMDDNRMEQYYDSSRRYAFKGYREAAAVLEEMRKPGYVPSGNDLQTVYRMFNYVLPYDGAGDSSKGHDVIVQRTKFFNALKEAGYGAVLDTNDAIYGGFKAKSPVIVFDMESVVPEDVKRTHLNEMIFSEFVMVGRKALGI